MRKLYWACILTCYLIIFSGCQVRETDDKELGSFSSERIVSLAPGITESLCELGLGPQLVAVTQADTYPDSVLELPRISVPLVDTEFLLSLDPTVIVLDKELNKGQALQFREQGVSLPLLEVETSLKNYPEQLRFMADKLKAPPAQSKQAIERSQELLLELEQNRLTSLETAFFLVWKDPLMVAGKGTLLHESLKLIGLKNSFADIDGYQQVNIESLIQKQPDFLIAGRETVESLQDQEPWNLLNAVRSQSFLCPGPDRLVRPTQRSLLEALRLQNLVREILTPKELSTTGS